MSTVAVVIAGCTLTTFLIKAAGPVALGGRDLPAPLQRALGLLAPALLSALVAVSVLAEGDRLAIGENTAGVLVGGVLFWRTKSVVGCVFVAAAVTALLRAV